MTSRLEDNDDDSSQNFEADMNMPTRLEQAMEDYTESDIEASQLPAIEEYKSQVAANRARANQVLARESYSPRSAYTESKKKHKEYMIFGVALLVIFLISVGVGVGIGNKEARQNEAYSPNDPYGGDFGTIVPPTGRPTHMYDSQTLEVVDFVTNMGWSDPVEARKQDSPQFRAANWIADFDPLQLDVADTLDFRQRYALAVFYYALDGDRWSFIDSLPWLTGVNVCDWRLPLPLVEAGQWLQTGVKCHGGTEIKEIVLPNSGLRGEIPSELGLLSGMEGLVLWENDLIGGFPAALRKLTLLQHIDFHRNAFGGTTLPSWLGELSQLTHLNVAYTDITGELPDLRGLSILDTINIGFNNIRDDVAKLGPLKNIRNLIGANNTFYGDLTSDLIFGWPMLEVMDMSFNNIGGSLPGNLFSTSRLEVLDLGGNSLVGSIPDAIIPESRLALLTLHTNKLQGDFDKITSHMTKLAHLDLSRNNFQGTIPVDWSRMTDLRYLFLAYNNFVPGAIPESLAQLSAMEDLSLQSTSRTGSIPSGFGQLSQLKLFDMSFNSLSGLLPSDIWQATTLNFLILQQNALSGEIPVTIESLDQLRVLLLDNNEFTYAASSFCDDNDQLDVCCTDAVDVTVEAICNSTRPWLGIMDPISEYEYRRGVYQFHDNDIRFPTQKPEATEPVVTQSPTVAPAPTATQRPTRSR